jgi:hypothetical protein
VKFGMLAFTVAGLLVGAVLWLALFVLGLAALGAL